MLITHGFVGTTRGKMKCLFFLLFEDYIEAQRGLSQAVKDELERFARNLGDVGAVVLPFAGDAPMTHRSVLDKNWSDAEKQELRLTPAILMVDQDFDDFDPHQHSWVLFHFDRADDPSYASKLRSLLKQLSDAVASTDMDAFAIIGQAIRSEAIAKASNSFKLEPGAFGVSIDLRSGFDALKQYLRGAKSGGA